MQVTGKVVVVTGGGNGIGKAMCEAFHRAGAAKVVVADIDPDGARAVATPIGGAAFKCDVGKEKDILHVIEETEHQFGPIALFCSNAGIGGGFDPLSVNAGGSSDEPWQRSWAVHVMAHVYAARHLIPRMKARGGGYFLNTISAAGLLSQVGSPAYSTTKHAAVGFAENLAISHKAHNIKVSILCPQGVDTNMLRSIPKGPQSGDGDLSPEQVAQDVLKGLEEEAFAILPHRVGPVQLMTTAAQPDGLLPSRTFGQLRPSRGGEKIQNQRKSHARVNAPSENQTHKMFHQR